MKKQINDPYIILLTTYVYLPKIKDDNDSLHGSTIIEYDFSSYKDIKLDYISFLHMFLGILYNLRNDKCLDIKIFESICFPFSQITSTLYIFRMLSNDK
jgi:hypothetical protein